MKMMLCVSCQDLLTRALHVLTIFAVFEKMTCGMPRFHGSGSLTSPHTGNGFKGSPKRMSNLQHLARIVRRSSAMSNAQTTYATFYAKFITFSNEIPSRLKYEAPVELRDNIGAVAQIIKPTDHVFEVHDVEAIVKYVMLTVSVTEKYLQGLDGCQFVRDDQQSWFASEKNTLDFMITLNKMALANLRMEAGDVAVVDAGLGGINTGVYGGMSESVLHQIRDLLIRLSQGCSQQQMSH